LARGNDAAHQEQDYEAERPCGGIGNCGAKRLMAGSVRSGHALGGVASFAIFCQPLARNETKYDDRYGKQGADALDVQVWPDEQAPGNKVKYALDKI